MCRSEPIWEVNKRKRRWKPVETLLSKSLEKLYELDKQEVIPIEGSDYKVDFRESDRVSVLSRATAFCLREWSGLGLAVVTRTFVRLAQRMNVRVLGSP